MNNLALNNQEKHYNTADINKQEKSYWDNDVWDIRDLEKFGIPYLKSTSNFYMRFDLIDKIEYRKIIKKYFKEKLMIGKNFTTGTAIQYLAVVKNFCNFLYLAEPSWIDFNSLERDHIVVFIQYLRRIYRGQNINNYLLRSINILETFLEDLQLREYKFAPTLPITKLILPIDKPNSIKKQKTEVDYIPDYVLNQLFDKIELISNKDIVTIIWILYKTGLRISDVLELKQDCLLKFDNKYWIETDIKKTYVKGHRIPIDDDLADLIAVVIDKTKKYTEELSEELSKTQKEKVIVNPDNYIFISKKGTRAGKLYSKDTIRITLNNFAKKHRITDENGKLYHFKNHSFRHTYAVKLINGGTDIITVQELLAHASPEMTLRYARLLDDTKRKAFDKAISEGLFSFNLDSELSFNEIPSDMLDMLWTNHKLNAIDTPYGMCVQKVKGRCSFAKQPPCLTCNQGNPCKDLCIGTSESDIKKYEILISSAKAMIEMSKQYNRPELEKENEELLKLYENIFEKISTGNIIYSRIDRIMGEKKNDKL